MHNIVKADKVVVKRKNSLASLINNTIQQRGNNPLYSKRTSKAEAIKAVCRAIKIDLDPSKTDLQSKKATLDAVQKVMNCDFNF